jgi:hypothetical protein
VTFEAAVEPMVWGRSTYTIIRLPERVLAALGPARRVEGEINDVPVNLAVTKAPVVDGAFLWAGKSLLDRVGIAPGQRLEVRLRPVSDDVVEVADDVLAALRGAKVLSKWKALSPGKQRGLLYQVDSAKTAATRTKRIAALVTSLAG